MDRPSSSKIELGICYASCGTFGADRGPFGGKDDVRLVAHAGTQGMGQGTLQAAAYGQDTGRTGPRHSRLIHNLRKKGWGTGFYLLHLSQETFTHQQKL